MSPVPEGHTIESIASFIDAVIPAIEVVDYRYVAWTIGALQVAADNAIHGAWVYGEPLTDWRALDLVAAGVTVTAQRRVRDDRIRSGGARPPADGDGLARRRAAPVRPAAAAGDVVTTGVTTGVFEATAGDAIEAVFDGIGSVSPSDSS